MRIVFINAPIRTNAVPNNPPLGIYYLGSEIQRRRPSWEVVYCDLNLYRPPPDRDELHAMLDRLPRADIYGLSGLITTYTWQKEIAWHLRRTRQHSKTVLGGGLASNLGAAALEEIEADAVCIGPGENVIAQILDDVDNDDLKTVYHGTPVENLDALRGIQWDEVDGLQTYIGNPIWAPDAGNCASWSSAYSPFTMLRSLSLITSRGCPKACAFCNRDITGRVYRGRSAHEVVREVVRVANRYTLDFVGFIDDNCAVDKARLLDIAEGVSEHAGVMWGGHARFDELDDGVLLKALARSGCKYLGFGGESANKDILKQMRKDNDPVQMARVVGLCREAGIHPNVSWIMGWPGETRSQIRETAQFIMEHTPEQPRMFMATAYPGTALWKQVKHLVIEEFGSLLNYVKQLGDATIPMMNFTSMSDMEFSDVALYASSGRLEEI